MKLHPFLRTAVLAVLVSLFMVSCADQNKGTEPGMGSGDTVTVTDKGLLKFQGEIFSIPSPVQTALLVKQSKVEFNEAILNDPANIGKYATENKKALNLGVYGADLAYLSNFKNTGLSQKYFELMGKLAQDLDILENIDQSLMQRFVENVNQPDSLLSLNADFYKEGDRYLKNSDRHQVAAMVLMGGWIEALHVACSAAAANPDIRSKVGEQRTALISLIKVFQKFTDEESIALATELTELSALMEELDNTYEFNKPITDQESRTTYLTSRTNVIIADDQLADISEKVEEIRNTIIQ